MRTRVLVALLASQLVAASAYAESKLSLGEIAIRAAAKPDWKRERIDGGTRVLVGDHYVLLHDDARTGGQRATVLGSLNAKKADHVTQTLYLVEKGATKAKFLRATTTLRSKDGQDASTVRFITSEPASRGRRAWGFVKHLFGGPKPSASVQTVTMVSTDHGSSNGDASRFKQESKQVGHVPSMKSLQKHTQVASTKWKAR